MLSDEELIELMINEPSWEDVLVRIVIEEKMDPWQIDLIRLADVFMNYIERMKQLDLRVPARFILIAAILLRMKSDILAPEKKKKTLIPEGEREEESKAQKAEIEILSKVPPLEPPVERIPVRTVTLEELIFALKKAFEVKERREIRRRRKKEVFRDFVEAREEDIDITERVNLLLNQIKTILEELEKEEVEFSKLVGEWKREKIVKTLLPILHLSQEGKVSYEQPKLFEEIYIKLKEKESAA
jgi:segregation and condensation protein A